MVLEVKPDTKVIMPDYYGWHPVSECKSIVEHFPYHIATAITYLWRQGRKTSNPLSDLSKAIDHIKFAIEKYKREHPNWRDDT